MLRIVSSKANRAFSVIADTVFCVVAAESFAKVDASCSCFLLSAARALIRSSKRLRSSTYTLACLATSLKVLDISFSKGTKRSFSIRFRSCRYVFQSYVKDLVKATPDGFFRSNSLLSFASASTASCSAFTRPTAALSGSGISAAACILLLVFSFSLAIAVSGILSAVLSVNVCNDSSKLFRLCVDFFCCRSSASVRFLDSAWACSKNSVYVPPSLKNSAAKCMSSFTNISRKSR